MKYASLSKIKSDVVTRPTAHIIAKITKTLNSSIEELSK